MIVIGSGILGLSVAEFFSRPFSSLVPQKRSKACLVTVVSQRHTFAGSQAAAANLATKGQQYARDPHFALKLQGKALYHQWISALLRETEGEIAGYGKVSPAQMYAAGQGCDLFSSPEDALRHARRVIQTDEGLLSHGKKPGAILYAPGSNQVCYLGEASVHARALLALLEDVCRRRGVVFFEGDAQQEGLLESFSGSQNEVIVCAGAWTPRVLRNLGGQAAAFANASLKKTRLTLGATFSMMAQQGVFPKDQVLIETVAKGHASKTTLSAQGGRIWVSASSVSLDPGHLGLTTTYHGDGAFLEGRDFDSLSKGAHLESKNEELFSNVTQCTQISSRWPELAQLEYRQNSQSTGQWEKNVGLRVGFGHSELVLADAGTSLIGLRVGVCAGAHKSGYLFAPVVGEALQRLHFGYRGL